MSRLTARSPRQGTGKVIYPADFWRHANGLPTTPRHSRLWWAWQDFRAAWQALGDWRWTVLWGAIFLAFALGYLAGGHR